jgi:hypothetical protein
MESPFKDFVLHDTWFDWEDPSLTPLSISRKLMGRVGYWNNPEFGEIVEDGVVVREAMEPHEIEREILFEAGRSNWGYESAYGKPYYQHMLTLMALLDEQTDITPSIADATQMFCESLSAGLKVLNLIGSQNSGKSAGSVRIAFCCLYVDPEFCQVFVANPFDNVADSTIWGEVLEMWTNICKTHPLDGDDAKTCLFPKGYVYANKTIIAIPNEPKGARIELRNVKKAGKFKGSKTRGKDTHRGIILVLVDEINEIESHAFLGVLPNLSSQDGFFCIDSQNFKEEDDLGGRIAEPVDRYDDSKSNYNDLNVDEDYFWPSAYSSMTLRFDGARSPNILAKRVIYGYLFKQADWDRLAEMGMESPDFFSQARSFPIRGTETDSVMPTSVVSNSRHDDTFYTRYGNWTRLSFCDPAFGGKDSALWGMASFGWALVPDGNGQTTRQLIFEVEDYFVKLRITKDAIYNDHWFTRLRAIGRDTGVVVKGGEVSPDDQVAIQCAELNFQYGIPADNFGYDFSMRSHIVTSMTMFVGRCHAFEYNRIPNGVYMEKYKMDSVAICVDRVSELAFLTAELYESGKLRGGEKCKTASMQLTRTKFKTVNKKKKCENKREYKARWQGQSPDHRDTLLGLRGMADIKGFSKSSLKVASSASHDSAAKVMSKFTTKRAKRPK